MNEYYKAWKEITADRDFVFKKTLSLFEGKPIKILEIGCLRTTDVGAARGDGFSSMHFAEYVKTFGGHLDIVELDSGNLEACKIVTSDFVEYISYFNEDGVEFLRNNNDYDLIYLDAADDCDLTVKMFELCDRKRSEILVDDWNPGGKADTLKVKYTDFELHQVNWLHQMGSYHKIQ